MAIQNRLTQEPLEMQNLNPTSDLLHLQWAI